MICSPNLRLRGTMLPWFRRWPRAGIAVAAAFYGAIVAWRVVAAGSIDETAVLLCLPIALVAVTWGFGAGLAAGVAAAAPIAVWAGGNGIALSELAALLLLGGLLGHAVDSFRASEAENRRLADATARYREAVELNDTVVQGLAAAKWALEARQLDRGLHIIDGTLESTQQLVADLLRDAGIARGTGLPDLSRDGQQADSTHP